MLQNNTPFSLISYQTHVYSRLLPTQRTPQPACMLGKWAGFRAAAAQLFAATIHRGIGEVPPLQLHRTLLREGTQFSCTANETPETSASCTLSPGLAVEPRECWQAKPVRINLRRVEIEGTETTDWFLPNSAPRRLAASAAAETDVTAGCWGRATWDQLALSPLGQLRTWQRFKKGKRKRDLLSD